MKKTIKIDFRKKQKTIKNVSGINIGAPTETGRFDLSPYFDDLNINYVRLHDAAVYYNNTVDIHNIFPDFDRDPDSPVNYDFKNTDLYLKAIKERGFDIVYRLGASVEMPRPTHIKPPTDIEKWARVCLNIVRHYNDGWANGFHYGIKYWEIWNEPDLNPKNTDDLMNFWSGSAQQYFELYNITAALLKNHDPLLKIGGPGLALDMEFAGNFLKNCREKRVPLDFFSWHSYQSEPYQLFHRTGEIERFLKKNGFSHVESHVNEWNYFPGEWLPMISDIGYAKKIMARMGSMEGAAFVAMALIYLQNTTVDVSNFYSGARDGDPEIWWQGFGMFDDTGKPKKNYHVFKAFSAMLDTPGLIGLSRPDRQNFAWMAGLSPDQSRVNILLSHFRQDSVCYTLSLRNLPRDVELTFEVYLLDDTHDLATIRSGVYDPKKTILEIELNGYSVCLVKCGMRDRIL
ncbi:MAG: hypothetical protein JW969_20600 [Spirochaetales bacterium]|nr:hypothetical protein [Spirochaetales bacterium]